MSKMQPVKLWGHPKGPNPLKVLIIICALDIPYELHPIGFADVKKEPFLTLNPNGRMPALEDPNTGVVLWESGAIIEYLVQMYDKDGKINYTTSPEKYQQHSWKHFQMSGQGPPFGQLVWFGRSHHEKLPSAIERYEKEQDRVFSVIELQLSRTGKQYLIGDKCSFADLMFVPWHRTGMDMPGDHFIDNVLPEKYPLANAWKERLFEHEAVKAAAKVAAETTLPH